MYFILDEQGFMCPKTCIIFSPTTAPVEGTSSSYKLCPVHVHYGVAIL